MNAEEESLQVIKGYEGRQEILAQTVIPLGLNLFFIQIFSLVNYTVQHLVNYAFTAGEGTHTSTAIG